MLFTTSQVSMLRIQAAATYEAAVIVEDVFCHTLDRVLCALTSERAIALYRLTYHAVMLCAAAAFFSGVLARRLFDAFMQWQANYVASCEEVVSEVRFTESPVTVSRTLALPPARERRHNTVEAIVNNVIITPAPAKRRGRPKGSKNRKAA